MESTEETWTRLFKVAVKIMELIMEEIPDPMEAYFVGTFCGEYTRHFFQEQLPTTELEQRLIAQIDEVVKMNVEHLLKTN